MMNVTKRNFEMNASTLTKYRKCEAALIVERQKRKPGRLRGCALFPSLCELGDR